MRARHFPMIEETRQHFISPWSVFLSPGQQIIVSHEEDVKEEEAIKLYLN
jgi:hypothetical protein